MVNKADLLDYLNKNQNIIKMAEKLEEVKTMKPVDAFVRELKICP